MNNDIINAATGDNQETLHRRLLRDQRGAGLVEYIMLAGLVAIAAVTAFSTFGTNVGDKIELQGATVTGIQSEPD